jgi:hypothetical protein
MSVTTIVWMLYALEEQEAMTEKFEKQQQAATTAAAATTTTTTTTTTAANTTQTAGDAKKGANLFKVSKTNPLEVAGIGWKRVH